MLKNLKNEKTNVKKENKRNKKIIKLGFISCFAEKKRLDIGKTKLTNLDIILK